MNNKVFNKLERDLEDKGKSAGTVREYYLSIRKLEDYFKGADLTKLTDEDLKEYAEYLINEGYSKTAYNSRIAAVRYLYTKVLKKRIHLEKIPFQRVRELNKK